MRFAFQNKLKWIAFSISFFFASLNNANASHLFGGEITWKCIGNGGYVFEVKVYRDCLGVPNWPSYTLKIFGNPSVCSVDLNIVTVNDLSPLQCTYNCNSPVLDGAAVQEFVFRTDTVQLPGVPPPTGWVFAIDDCCRNALQNLNGGGQGFTLRSVMFPYGVSNTSPCFDSSPYFAEKPITIACTGYPFSYNPNATDEEKDSLVYSWSNCLDNITSNPCSTFAAPIIPFNPAPYTQTNQLPGNPTLNSATGELNFFVPDTNSVIGNFATCIKVTAYRCGVKIAEVYRDCGFKLINNCLVFAAPPNHINVPPTISAPFINPLTGLQTEFADTVMAGDTVIFNFSATDPQMNFGASGLQTVTLQATGSYFGAGFTNAASGCLNPPCATLNPPPPITATTSASTQFKWVTDCSLIDIVPQNCNNSPLNTYYFILKANDNYCPVPAYKYATIAITVIRPLMYHSNDSLWISSSNASLYQWYNNGVAIPGANDSLFVYTVPGNYTCKITMPSGCQLNSPGVTIPVGIPGIDFFDVFTISPNPTRGKFVLNISSSRSKNINVFFTDVAGRIILSEKINLKEGINSEEYDAGKFSKGIYFVKVGEGSGAVTRKIVIQ